MLLELSLPKDKVIWALVHPVCKEYIHSLDGVGYQEKQLIITEKNQPVKVNTEDYPLWAKLQIMSSLKSKDLINTGEPIIEEEKLETTETQEEEKVGAIEILDKPSKTKSKKGKTQQKHKNE